MLAGRGAWLESCPSPPEGMGKRGGRSRPSQPTPYPHSEGPHLQLLSPPKAARRHPMLKPLPARGSQGACLAP